ASVYIGVACPAPVPRSRTDGTARALPQAGPRVRRHLIAGGRSTPMNQPESRGGSLAGGIGPAPRRYGGGRVATAQPRQTTRGFAFDQGLQCFAYDHGALAGAGGTAGGFEQFIVKGNRSAHSDTLI